MSGAFSLSLYVLLLILNDCLPAFHETFPLSCGVMVPGRIAGQYALKDFLQLFVASFTCTT